MKAGDKRPRIVVISGAESTGKSVLTRQLGEYFNSRFYPEYAREYLEEKGAPYTFSDVEAIAAVQLQQMEEAVGLDSPVVFFDTWLIITNVWFEVVYGTVPSWIPEALKRAPVDLYLLCANDIPWVADPLRENGGEMRELLFNRYRENISEFGFACHIVTGTGEERVKNGLQPVRDLF